MDPGTQKLVEIGYKGGFRANVLHTELETA